MKQIKLATLLAVSATVPWVFLDSTEIESYEPIVTVTKSKPLISYKDFIILLEKYNNEYEYIDVFKKYDKYLDYTVDHVDLDIEYTMGCELPSLRIYLKEKLW